MSAQRQSKPINPDVERELARRLARAKAENRPAEMQIAGHLYRLVPVDGVRTAGDPFANYDPERARAAVTAAAGALEGLDVEAFLEEIMEMREQDTPGHRWP